MNDRFPEMNEIEAKVILANYPLGESPFDDPRFDEAWRVAKSNQASMESMLAEYAP